MDGWMDLYCTLKLLLIRLLAEFVIHLVFSDLHVLVISRTICKAGCCYRSNCVVCVFFLFFRWFDLFVTSDTGRCHAASSFQCNHQKSSKKIFLQSSRPSCQIEELKQEVLDRTAFQSPPRWSGSTALLNDSEKVALMCFALVFPTKPISGLTDARRCRRATFKKSLEDKMCVTRHSRLPPSVRADIFVNTGAIHGALHFTWHFVLQRYTPLQLYLLFMKSHLHSHYNKCQQSKGPTCFSMSVITWNLSWCCVKDCPLHSLYFFPSVFFVFF